MDSRRRTRYRFIGQWSRNGWTAPSQAAEKQSEMKTKNLPLDNAVATGDAPRDVLVTRWG